MEKNKLFLEKTEKFVKDLEKLQDKYNIKLSAELKFDMYKELPTDLKLAVEVIKHHKGRLDIVLTEKVKENGNNN